MQDSSPVFLYQADKPWEDAGKDIARQVLGYDGSLMLVKVKFATGAVSDKHAHPHAQSTYVVSGKFRIEIGDETKILSAGDGFYVPPNAVHGAACIEGGMLVDAFSPCREDFL